MNYFLGIRQSDGVLAADFEDTATGLEPSGRGRDADPGQRRLAPRGGDLRRHDLAPVSGRRARRAARRRRLHAARRQHPARRDRHGAQLDGRRHERRRRRGSSTASIDEARIWNHARTAQQISRGRTPRSRTRPGCSDAGASTKAPAPSWPTAPGHAINGTVTGTNYAWVAGAPFSTLGNTAPSRPPIRPRRPCRRRRHHRRPGQRHRRRRRRADGDVGRRAGARHGGDRIRTAPSPTRRLPAYGGPDGFTYAISDGQGGTASSRGRRGRSQAFRTWRRSSTPDPIRASRSRRRRATLSARPLTTACPVPA